MDNYENGNTPHVVLGGGRWPVPPLSAKQNRIIDPFILGLLPLFSEWQSDKATALTRIGSKQYEALLEIAFVAISREHPELTRDAFLDLPVTLPELICAFSIIAQQTGIFEKSPGDKTPGEAAGA